MFRDLWEFSKKETKAWIIFAGILILAVILIVTPYFVNVLNHHEYGVSMEIVEPEEAVESTEPTEGAVVEINETPSEEQAESENAEETTGKDEVGYGYGYDFSYATNNGAAASQPVVQTSPEPVETITRTTVDDNSVGDDGYTMSGIDNPGADEDVVPTDSEDGEEDSEV